MRHRVMRFRIVTVVSRVVAVGRDLAGVAGGGVTAAGVAAAHILAVRALALGVVSVGVAAVGVVAVGVLAVGVVAVGVAAPGPSAAPLFLDAAWFDATTGGPHLIPSGWRYQPGDNVAWRQPDFDDSDWPVLGRTDMAAGRQPVGGFPGAGWFRLHLAVAPDVAAEDLAYDLDFTGAAAVYLDGLLLAEFGEIGATAAESRDWHDLGLRPHYLRFATPGRHVLAVRFHNVAFGRFRVPNGIQGFEFYLGRFAAFTAATRERQRAVTALNMTGFGALLIMGVLHLLLFVLQPSERGNLWSALALIAVGAIAALTEAEMIPAPRDEIMRLMQTFRYIMLAVAVFFTCFYVETLRPPWRWPLWLVVAAAAAVAATPLVGSIAWTYAVLGLALAVASGVVIWAVLHRRRGARILAVGLLFCLVFVGYQILADLNLIERRTPDPLRHREYLPGMFGLLLSMSFYIAFRLRVINRQLERRIDEVRRLGEERTRALARLTAGVAHEINSPVGAIQSGADTVRRAAARLRRRAEGTAERELDLGGSPDERLARPAGRRRADGPAPGRADIAETASVAPAAADRTLRVLEEAAGTIGAGAERIATIVERMRRFTHLDEAERQRIDLDEGIDQALAMLAGEMGASVRIERERGDLPPVFCAPALINQVFLNLLRNARESMAEGVGTITITTELRDDRMLVRIGDDGRGIPADQVRRVFDPGYTTKSGGIGTGLGLAISRRIVEEHGGQLTLHSRPGRGTTALVILPLGGAPHDKRTRR